MFDAVSGLMIGSYIVVYVICVGIIIWRISKGGFP